MSAASTAYKTELLRFLRFKFGGSSEGDISNQELLLQITDQDVANYLTEKAFGKTDPGPQDMPIAGRSNTLKCIKKKLSIFMPRKNIVWDEVQKRGNPTRSVAVNEVINKVMRCEVRRQGAPSHVVREIEYEEFIQLIDLIRREATISEAERYRIASAIALQWHLIARIDDMMKLQGRDIFPHQHFTQECIMVQMKWSKNITEERDSAKQFIIGSMEEELCPLVSLAVFAEAAGSALGGDAQSRGEQFIYGDADGHRKIRRVLDRIFGEQAAFAVFVIVLTSSLFGFCF